MNTGKKPWKRHPELTTDEITSARMSKVRQKGTRAELTIRGVARYLGMSYRVSNRDLPGSPDLANRRRRWVLFVHGCFWHGHEDCPKARLPKRNAAFWAAKVEANKRRDAEAERCLREMGYAVGVVWDCELREFKENPRRLLERIR